ncbi:MAG: ABC transporter permease [Pirellulales bacterium]|nr:ABC transporter permease [Pirellulales bacterium]
MRWIRTWQLGLKSLWLHPLRSLLTVLGIFIGVASVIWLLAIGEGIGRKAQEQIEGLGANNVIVRSIKPPPETFEGTHGPVPFGLLREDFERLTETIPTVKRALPIREIKRQRFSFGGRTLDGRLVGCTPEYAEVTQLEVTRGRFITDVDQAEKQNFCALAADVARRLFPYEDPLGRSVRVEDTYYVVIGIMKDRAPSAGIGGSLEAQDYSNDIYIPISTLWSRIGDTVVTVGGGSFQGEIVELSQITFQIEDTDRVLETAAIIESTLDRFHSVKDFGVTVPLELIEQAKTTRLMFILMIGLIAAISLVVGGIGIMNIMLATVTERTREIGIRRALGARRRDIVRQFLIETISLSIVGGVTGVVGGLTCRPIVAGIRWLLDRTLPDVIEQLPAVIKTVEPVIVPWSIPLAFGISVVVGVIFGLYPAIRAARMDPIEALRHE